MRKPAIWRSVVVWFTVLALANLIGAVREMWLIRIGLDAGRSTVRSYCAVWFWSSHGSRSGGSGQKLEPRPWGGGGLWVILTLACLVGHYVFRKPWSVLLEDYDVSRGRIWVAVLVVVLLAPSWTARVRGFLGDQP